ncbi:transposase [Bacteroides acidifaciens]|uniref:transposase n=1 Tax=Bacteroides acidifaciens TaxID=85831 RepID=UPI003315E0FF
MFLFFLPPYSPHLNIAETLWRMLKGQCGYSLRIMSRLTICSTLSIEAWRGWANPTLSTSPKKA